MQIGMPSCSFVICILWRASGKTYYQAKQVGDIVQLNRAGFSNNEDVYKCLEKDHSSNRSVKGAIGLDQ